MTPFLAPMRISISRIHRAIIIAFLLSQNGCNKGDDGSVRVVDHKGADATEIWKAVANGIGNDILNGCHVTQSNSPESGEYYFLMDESDDEAVILKEKLAKLAAENPQVWKMVPKEKLDAVMAPSSRPPPWWNVAGDNIEVWRLNQYESVATHEGTGGFFFVFLPGTHHLLVRRWIP